MKKNMIVSCGIVACVAVLISFSNMIVACFSGPHFEKFKGHIVELEKDYVMHELSEFVFDDESLLEQVVFKGWAYCSTDIDNSDKKIGIVLSNDKEKYLYCAQPSINRWDITMAMFPPANGDLHGFATKVSTLLVADGIYDVYIYCKENEKNYGLEQTQYSMIKNGREIKVSDWTSKYYLMTELSHLQYDAMLSIDTNESEEDGILLINGWAFLPDLFSGDQIVIICLEYEDGEMAFFTTRRTRRQDVANYFDNPLYSVAGFEARIPTEKILPKPYDVTILLKDEEGLHTSSTGRKQNVVLTEDEVKHIDLTYADKDVRSALEIKEMGENGELTLRGWAFVENVETENQTVFVRLIYADGSVDILRTEQMERPDVAQYFSNDLYGMSGFRTQIRASQLRPMDYMASVVIEVGNEFHISE